MTAYAVTWTDYLESLKVLAFPSREHAEAATNGLPNERTVHIFENEAELLTSVGRGPVLLDLYNRLAGEDVKRFSDTQAALRRTLSAIVKAAQNQPMKEEDKMASASASENVQPAANGPDPAAPPKVGRGNARFKPDQVIHLLVDKNPKKMGSAAHALFDCYRNGMTVGDFIQAGGTHAALAWDSDEKRKFIEIQ